jgi:isomerase DpgB
MSTDTITPCLDIDGARPPSAALVDELHAFVDRVEDSLAAVAVLRLTGGTPEPGPVDIALVNKWERALRRLERLAATTVAVVRGECGGVALEALLTTDYRVGTPDVALRLPSGGGPAAAWPGMALYRLANQVGVARVRRAVLFDVPVTASAAVELGLLDQVADSIADAEAIADAFAPRPDSDVAVRRQLLLEATTTTFEDALGRHLAACDRVLRGGAA